MEHCGDDESMALSSHALAALQEFYADRDALKAKFEDLRVGAEKRHEAVLEAKPLSIGDFGEDWQESQFWYSDETANVLARQLLDGATSESTIVAVSAPSVFIALKNAISARGEEEPRPKLVLLEHDSRFSVFPEYVFYDCNQPLKLPAHLKGVADGIACDPPFLNEDCQTKEAMTVRWLARPAARGTAGDGSDRRDQEQKQPRVVLCTGERMEELLTTKLYGPSSPLGLRTTTFRPEHANKLSNEFYCYANFECDDWGWKGGDDAVAPAA